MSLKFKSKETKVFWFSDPHFYHTNICTATSEWKDKSGCRDFVSTEAMTSYIINEINNTVGSDDVLFCLGDWSFGGIENIKKSRDRIVCKNIHLVLGNHDHNIEGNKKFDGILLQELFTSVSHYLKVSVDGQLIVMSHFPMISWEKSYASSWMLHGHTHGTLYNNQTIQWGGDDYWYKTSKILDVGIDSIHMLSNTYKPLSFQQIRKIMNKKSILQVDHHNERTQ